jgi:hypothetical protein
VKVGDHIIQVTQFKNLGFIVQNDIEIKANVNHRIQVGCLKWRRVSGVLCDTNILFKLKYKNIK